jgi:hypothetical protein
MDVQFDRCLRVAFGTNEPGSCRHCGLLGFLREFANPARPRCSPRTRSKVRPTQIRLPVSWRKILIALKTVLLGRGFER